MNFHRKSLLFAGWAMGAGAWAAVPVLDHPIPLRDESQSSIVEPPHVAPVIPVGKTLLFPITASDADGDALSYNVTSSNPNILVRAKTGNPALRLTVAHAANGADDPAFGGTMEFMLFRDWLPASAGFVGGMAQAGFYDNVIFHRIADLGGGAGTTGFIYQGGDPLGTGGGGPGIVGGDSSTAWKFQNEFSVGTIFSGRGQLAMANAGTSTGYALGGGGTLIVPDYLDTNGSQFFITDGQPRHLDFKHNIFGQMLRGWELLPNLKATKTTSSTPNKEVKIISAKVVANETDAVLVLSAKAVGTAVITVTATDPSGARDVKKFTVTAAPDATNCNPFIRRNVGHMTAKDTPAVFGLEAVDLEFDYLDVEHSLLPLSASLGPKGTLLATSGRIVQMQPNPGYVGLINAGFSVRQYDIGGGGFGPIADYTNAYIAAGDRAARAEAVTISAIPGVAFSNAIVAKIADVDATGAPGNFTAKINWADGTPLDTAIVSRDLGTPGSSRYLAAGSHVYARAGTYPVVVDFNGNSGSKVTVRSTAVVSGAALRAFGENVDVTGARVVNRVVATFTDTLAAPVANYSARVDWGDGIVSGATISRDAGSGKYMVRGTHGYRDSEPFSVRVRLHKKDDLAASDAIAWSTVTPRFTAAPHLPPFPHPKLTIAWNSGPTKSHTGVPGPSYQVTYNGVFVIINSGSLPLASSQLRFWLSSDRILKTSGPGRDTPLIINDQPLLDIIPFPAGAGGNGNFKLTVPKGESTGRKFILSEAVYDDPIANADGTEKVVVTGPLPASVLVSTPGPLHTTEAGGTATFTVVLDTAPVNTAVAGATPNDSVTLPLESSLVTEGTVAPASLVFNASNWNVPQTVTVTGVDDANVDGNKTFKITLKAAQSADPLYNNLIGPEVTVINDDNEPAPPPP